MSKVLCLSVYKDFKCKCENCRNTCCKLWKIDLDQNEYYCLLGLDVDKKMRERIDKTFSMCNHPTPIAFAEVNLDYFGNCPLLEKGLCELQCECGYDKLPKICKQYPRCKRKLTNDIEICLSNSCEETLELLYQDKQVNLEYYDLEDDLLLEPLNNELPEDYLKIRQEFIDILQNKKISLDDRIKEMVNKFHIEKCKLHLWDESFILYLKIIINKLFSKSLYLEEIEKELLSYLDTFNKNEFINNRKKMVEDNLFTETFLENVIYNHCFYVNYPFVDQVDSYFTSFIGFLAVYGLINIVLVYKKHQTKEQIIDSLAFMFRLIEHSSFYYNCNVIYKEIFEK